jgi:hypothetical protein
MPPRDRFFLRRDGEVYLPAPAAIGPWGPGTMSGMVVAGLVAHAAECAIGGDGFLGTRLTVDMIRMATIDKTTATATVLREGRRLRLVDVAVEQNGRGVAHGRVVFTHPSPTPDGQVWSDPAPVPIPTLDDDWPAGRPRAFSDAGGESSGDFDVWRDPAQRKYMWFRFDQELVEGEAMSGFVRAACVADAANPLTNWGSSGLQYVNSDVNLMLAREPVGPLVGLAARDRQENDGISIGVATMHDLSGPVGSCAVTGLASEVAMQIPEH